jgi:hypothetical protein
MNEFDIAQRLARHLDHEVAHLDSTVVGRLHEARFQALSRVPVQQLRLATAGHSSGSGNWNARQHTLRLGAALLMVAVVLMGYNYWEQQMDDEAGQMDARLLSSELPPQAFIHQNFGEWLQETR